MELRGGTVYPRENLEEYLTWTCFRGFWWDAEVCYLGSNLNKRSVKLLKSAAKKSNSSESLRAWIKGDSPRMEDFSLAWLLTTVVGAIIMLAIMIGSIAMPVLAAVWYDPLFRAPVPLLAICAMLLVLPTMYCIEEALLELRLLRLQRFYRRHQPMRLTLLVDTLVDAVADQLRQLETPLSEEGADDPDRVYLKLACTMRADDLEGFVLKNRALIEALEAAHREGIKVPKLERREMKKRLQDGASRIAIQIDTCQRMALEAAQRQKDEKQRQKERERLHKQSLRRLKEGAVLTQLHAALGWTPQDVAVMRAFDALEAEQAKERAAQASLLARGKRLVKQLLSTRKGKKPKRKEKSKRKGKKS